MKIVNIILADLIRRGQVTVDIPGLDMERLEKTIHGHAEKLLWTVTGIVFEDEMEKDDSDKIRCLQELLREI